MAIQKILIAIITSNLVNAVDIKKIVLNDTVIDLKDDSVGNVFDGVYSECLLKFSYSCLQKKTLLYLKSLNQLSEVSIIGDYVKFVKINASEGKDDKMYETSDPEELSYVIDKAVDNFFDSHLLRFSALGKDVRLPNTVEKFVGRKKRKGGGGGGHGGGDDGGKKKMFMMAMMCMKMKMMMMVPAMMGMMGMMSFKGMMFSMMSFMISKMMLLMKLLEKKGGSGSNSWNSGGDGGWASSGSGAWMPAGQDYGSGGGYDSNGQWQSRSIIEVLRDDKNKPKVTYVKPLPYIKMEKPYLKNNEVKFIDKPKLRRRRGIIDAFHNAYRYWINKFLGVQKQHPKFRVMNGVKYVYHPNKVSKRIPKLITNNSKPSVVTEDFNKGEIVEGSIEGRMTRRKFNKMKDNVKEAVDENPWE